jgi:hypothetical protein
MPPPCSFYRIVIDPMLYNCTPTARQSLVNKLPEGRFLVNNLLLDYATILTREEEVSSVLSNRPVNTFTIVGVFYGICAEGLWGTAKVVCSQS